VRLLEDYVKLINGIIDYIYYILYIISRTQQIDNQCDILLYGELQTLTSLVQGGAIHLIYVIMSGNYFHVFFLTYYMYTLGVY